MPMKRLLRPGDLLIYDAAPTLYPEYLTIIGISISSAGEIAFEYKSDSFHRSTVFYFYNEEQGSRWLQTIGYRLEEYFQKTL